MASFFSRPNITNEQFKQLGGPNNIITLSGQTQIATASGLTLTDGLGGYIPVIATGATNYDVLTYCNGRITLLPASGGGSGVYSGASPTTCSVGGLNQGSAILGCSISLILEKILVPAIPVSTSLSVVSSTGSRQFGDSSVGNLCYNVIKNTNSISAICLSTNGSGVCNVSIPVGAGNTCTGTTSYSYPASCASPTSGFTSTSVSYGLTGRTVCGEISTSNVSINWGNKKFFFANATLYSNSLITPVLSATTGTISTTKSLSVTQILNNQFFYYVYPYNFPGASTPSFVVNGLPNNAWGNSSNGTLFVINFINTNGYLSKYYVARSDNRITGSFNITVS